MKPSSSSLPISVSLLLTVTAMAVTDTFIIKMSLLGIAILLGVYALCERVKEEDKIKAERINKQ